VSGVSFDAHEVDRLAADLGRVPGRIVPEVEKVVAKGALNIRKGWRNRWKGLSHLPRLAGSINYDLKVGLGGIEAEIGADKGKPQGPLASIAEFGTVNNAPHPGGAPALAAEAPKFEKALGDAAEKAIDL
jgi:hypothetical protein